MNRQECHTHGTCHLCGKPVKENEPSHVVTDELGVRHYHSRGCIGKLMFLSPDYENDIEYAAVLGED